MGDACPACGDAHYDPFGHKSRAAMSFCAARSAALFFTNARASEDAVDALYQHYYYRSRFDIWNVAANSLDRLAQSFGRFRDTGCWLDVGYGEGGCSASRTVTGGPATAQRFLLKLSNMESSVDGL